MRRRAPIKLSHKTIRPQANQPTQHTLGGTTTPITHDNQGNRLTGPAPSGESSTYTWSQANRLATANGTTFTYDATGLRVSRTPATEPGQTYTWDTTQTVPLMLTDGALNYIYDNAGNPVEHIDAGGTVHYYQHDQYGSTRLLTDSTGSVAATYTFDPYGNLAQKTGTADTVLRWNGQTQDTDTGLYYLRARYYDPATTQFISKDPLASLTLALYSYANNNPLNMQDPLGLWSWNPFEWNSNELAVVGTVLGFAALAATGPLALGIAAVAVAVGTVALTKDVADGADGFTIAMDVLGAIPGVGALGRSIRAGAVAEEMSYSFANLSKTSSWDYGAAISSQTGTTLNVLRTYGDEQERERDFRCK